jgi:hypothetical protein
VEVKGNTGECITNCNWLIMVESPKKSEIVEIEIYLQFSISIWATISHGSHTHSSLFPNESGKKKSFGILITNRGRVNLKGR